MQTVEWKQDEVMEIFHQFIERDHADQSGQKTDDTGGSYQWSGNVDDLHIRRETKNLIRNGAPNGERSEPLMTVLNALVGCGLSDSDIFGIFDQYPIGDKYRGKGRVKEKWLQKQIDKARARVTPRTNQSSNADAGAKDDDGEKKKKKPSMADLLVGLVPEGSLFHSDDCAYVDLHIQGHRETWPVKSKAFRDWLAHTAFSKFEKAPSSQAMQDALSTICGKALFQGPEREVYVRIGEHKGCIYLDLGRADWVAVEIAPEG